MPVNTDSHNTGLSYNDNISVAWKAVDHELNASHLALVNESNEAFLRAVSAIGEFARDLPEDSPELSQEMARLDIKLNLLLDLVSKLIYAQLAIPETSPATVSSTAISWTTNDAPPVGQLVFLEVYIQRGTPKPLCFYGKVTSSSEDQAAGRCRAEYVGLGGSAQAWLEKLIFRHHRREIAYRKSLDSET
tara:strand:+ start:32693 stop:33262 length:570 start_codon:yes stop_codon:yes gene_type:complete